jgi:hypothetical protein
MERFTLMMLASAVLGCGSSTDASQRSPAPFEDTALDAYELAVLPDASALAGVLGRPEERFVMVNMLAFKEAATGEGFEGLTGAEAYAIYTDGLIDAQMAIGSRLIWSGSVQAQVVGVSEPLFETMALLEYASPQVFLGFAQQPGDAPEARSAGLLGQWLVASTTLEEQGVVEPADAGALPSAEEVARGTGLTEAQAARLLDGPADEVVSIVELLRFSDGTGEAYQPYRDALDEAAGAQGASLVWRGSSDSYVLGAAVEPFHEMVVTSYPNRAAYIDALSDPAVLSSSPARVEGLANHWIYTAGSATGFSF